MATQKINTVAAQSELMSEIAAGERAEKAVEIAKFFRASSKIARRVTVDTYTASAVQVYVKVDGRNIPATLTQPAKLERVIAALAAEGFTVSRCVLVDCSFTDVTA